MMTTWFQTGKQKQNNDTFVFNASQKQIACLIAEKIVIGSESKKVRKMVVDILRDKGIPLYPFSFAQLEAIYEFCNKNVDYMRDIANTETLYSADRILENRFGDCDDKTILSLSMLRSLGYDTAIVYLDIDNTNDFQHIFGMVLYKRKLIPFDTVIINGHVGSMAKKYYHMEIMPVI